MERRSSSSIGADPATAREHEVVDEWIRELDHLDELLEKPARSLIKLADMATTCGINDGRSTIHRVPTTVDVQSPRVSETLFVHAVVGSAVQALHNRSRRFDWLTGSDQKMLQSLSRELPTRLISDPALQSQDPIAMLDALPDIAFGTLSPLVAAEVFWLLVRAGEGFAHGDLGFLALFALLWALKRRTAGPFDLGASLGFWRPTVAVTARCLLPILRLNGIVRRRAALWRDAKRLCDEIEKSAPGRNQYQRWQFASQLDRLAGILHELAGLSIEPKDFHDTADDLTNLASPLTPLSPTAALGPKVRERMRQLFSALREQNARVLARAEHATHVVQKGLLDILATDSERREHLGNVCNLIPAWDAQFDAAKRAHTVCAEALKQLQTAVELCDRLPRGAAFTHETLLESLEHLATINDRVHDILGTAIEDNVEWCVRSIGREVAHASAQNDTDFDATELLSGVVIGEWTERISRMQATDAVRLSLRAARQDGSWWSGQPVFLEKRALGVWPSTTDIMLLLATAVQHFDDIDCADPHIKKFVDWLEGRLVRQHPKWWTSSEPLWGWTSEAREPGIDIWTTATAVKTLLEIRDIIEDRLWSICEDRFTVLSHMMTLSAIDPVDLGARHRDRLQTRLLRNAARAKLNEEDAEYSFVLHGPPGSSKSVIAQAIAREMWPPLKGKKRFVRITPADFTRRGEPGLDVEARFIFRLLSHVRRVTILFDEIDDLLRVRDVGAEPAFIRLIVPGMLNRLQDLHDAATRQELCFLLGVNYVDQIEPALTRPGRIDAPIPVPYPDAWSRESILERIAPKVTANVKDHVVSNTGEWPWSTYQKLCKELREEPTIKRADEAMSDLRVEFQPPDFYYKNPKRWLTTSPLVTEFVHVAFGISKRREDCRQRVLSLITHLEKNKGVSVGELGLIEKFEGEWRRESRS